MEVLRSEDWSSISYCCGWGRRASRGPNPLLQAQLGGLRMVPVPWLTSSKPAQMSWSPSTHPPITNTHTLKYPLLLELSLDPTTKTKHSGDISYHKSTHPLFELVSLVSHLLCNTPFFLFPGPSVLHLVLRGLPPSISCPLTPSMVRFLNDLSMEMSLSLSILCCPLVAVCFQIGNQGQEAPAKTLSVRFWKTHLNKNRK